MASSKKLVQMAKRWTKAVGASRRTTIFPEETSMDVASSTGCERVNAAKGYFAMYSNDGKRFVVPLKWLASDIFGEMLKMAEEEFGLPRDGPITLPIDAFCMEEVVRLMKTRKVMKDLGAIGITRQ